MEDLSAFIKSRGKQPEEGEGRHVLMIQDTTELNYNNLNGLLKVNDPDIGPISDNKSTGILLHPSLAVDALSGIPYGISSIQVWNRPFAGENKNERGYQNLPIEEKESNKWLVAAQQGKEWLNGGNSITLVGDRENDIYEYFALVPDERTDVLVRSSWNRRLASGRLLTEELEGIDWHSDFDLEIKGNQKRTARKARMRIKWAGIGLARPENKDKVLYPKAMKIAVVEVLEDPQTVPQGESPVCWRLFTTHSVESLEQAMQIVEWYKWRWWIEDFFRVLKTQGLEIERSQLSTGASLKKLVVLCLEQALKILMMRQERQGKAAYHADICFEQEEIAFLEVLHAEQQARIKRQNPHQPRSLAWAAWIIAVLAGWTPADLAKRPPGVVTLSRGLKIFIQRYLGWETAMMHFQQINKDRP